MQKILIIIAALMAATAAHADQAEDAAALLECAKGGDYPEACIGNVANPCMDTAVDDAAQLACITRETQAWRASGESLYITAATRFGAIGDDLPDLLENSQEGWEDYAYNHCRLIGLSTPNPAFQETMEARCTLHMNANRIIELMYLGME